MYNIRTEHFELKGDPFEFVKSRFNTEGHDSDWFGKRRYLAFDRESGYVWAHVFDSWDWSGVRINSDIPEKVPEKQIYISTYIGDDPHLRLLMDGYYVRFATVNNIFTQFPGPYDVIVMANTGKDRELWESANIFKSLPKVFVLAEDGHNEQVIKIGWDRGYTSHVSEDWLVMVHR